MGISRLVYGRSAMQGLYLNPDAWYDERDDHDVAEHARARDRPRRARGRARHRRAAAVRPAGPRDGLARSFVPPIEGFGVAGDRRAAHGRRRDAAARLRPAPRRTRAVVAGGGLLGLEAAYALHKLGLQDHRAGALRPPAQAPARRARGRAPAQRYLEGLGLEIVIDAETDRSTATAACAGSTLARRPRLDAQILLVAAGITPNIELAQRGRAHGQPRRARRRPHAHRDPAIFAAGDVAEFEGQLPGPVADRGRPGRGGGRERRRRRQALRGGRAGHDPQGRRHRADLDRPLRGRPARTTR